MGTKTELRVYCEPHSGGYRYRRRVPLRHQPLVGQKWWLAWLGSDRRQALKKAIELADQHDELVRRLGALPEPIQGEIKDSGGAAQLRASAHFDNYLAAVAWTATAGFNKHLLIDASRKVKLADKLEGEASGLEALLQLWKAAKPRAYKDAQRGDRATQRFIKIVDDLDMGDVEQRHAVQFRDGLEAMGLTPDNVKQHLSSLARMFKLAVSEGRVKANPFTGIQARIVVAKRKSDKVRPFTSAEARAIFDRLPTMTPDDAMVRRLCAYHGARSGEVAQMRAADVLKVEGVDVLRFTPDAGSLKNLHSERDVPIHPACADVIEHARTVAAAHGPEARLFQSFVYWESTGWAGGFQKRSGVLIRELGIKGNVSPTHSWRHRAIDLLREQRCPPDIERAIVGHARGSDTHSSYGAGPTLKRMAKWIKRIDPLK